MKPLDRALERRLRTAWRRELAASPDLAREERRVRGSRFGRTVQAPFALVAPFLFLLPSFLAVNEARPEVSLLALSLAATAAVFVLSSDFRRRLWGSRETVVFGHLPMSDALLFGLHARTFLQRSLVLPAGLAMYYLLFILFLERSGVAAGAAGIGLLQGFAGMAFAAALAAWSPRRLGQAWGYVFLAALLPCFLYSRALEDALLRTRGFHLLALPTAWGSFAARGWILHGQPAALAGAAASILFASILFLALRSLRARFRVPEFAAERASTAEAAIERMLETAPPEARRSLPDQVEAWIRTREFLEPRGRSAWRSLERFFFSRLSPRERDVAAFVLPEVPLWTGRWKTSLLLALAGAALLLFAGVGGQLRLLVACLPVVPMLAGRFPVFELQGAGSGWLPLHAAFPLPYKDVARILLKAAILRIGSILPLILAMGAAAGYAAMRAPLGGALAGLKVAALLVAAQPIATAIRFMGGTDSAFRLSWRGCFTILPLLLGLMLLFLAGAAVTFHPDPVYAAAAFGAALVASGAYGKLVALHLERASFDWGRSTPPAG